MTATTEPNITVVDDSSPGPFEGPEKLLELWFAPSEHDVPQTSSDSRDGAARRRGQSAGSNSAKWTGLRQVERSVWDSMLDEVQCKVLSVIEGDDVDAYLLSESSMFVWPHKLILKTCGTTTLLLGLPTLLRIASEKCGFGGVWRCFYSRKTFMFPERQRGPHKDWSQETDFLDKLFQNSSAYTVGRMNGDHWLLYLTPPQDNVLAPNALASSKALAPSNPTVPLADLSASLSTNLTSPALSTASATAYFPAATSSAPSSRRPPAAAPPPNGTHLNSPSTSMRAPHRPDQTLEILMSHLHPSACASFYHPSSTPDSKSPYKSPLYPSDSGDADAHALGRKLSDELGISALMPDATLDSFLFTPCGYSANAVQGDRYATIHVTPEEAYSYASFECNLDFVEQAPSSNGKGTSSLELEPVKEGEMQKTGPKSLQQLVEHVLAIFKPAKLSITLFVSVEEEEDEEENDGSRATTATAGVHSKPLQLLSPKLLERYNRVDRIGYTYDGYVLTYCVFEEKAGLR